MTKLLSITVTGVRLLASPAFAPTRNTAPPPGSRCVRKLAEMERSSDKASVRPIQAEQHRST
jgi:hypothetical protein